MTNIVMSLQMQVTCHVQILRMIPLHIPCRSVTEQQSSASPSVSIRVGVNEHFHCTDSFEDRVTIGSKRLCMLTQVSESVFVPPSLTRQYLCPASGCTRALSSRSDDIKSLCRLISRAMFKFADSAVQAFRHYNHQRSKSTKVSDV